jgi:hypothetical protein
MVTSKHSFEQEDVILVSPSDDVVVVALQRLNCYVESGKSEFRPHVLPQFFLTSLKYQNQIFNANILSKQLFR